MLPRTWGLNICQGLRFPFGELRTWRRVLGHVVTSTTPLRRLRAVPAAECTGGHRTVLHTCLPCL